MHTGGGTKTDTAGIRIATGMNTTTITTIRRLENRLVPGAQLILGCALLLEHWNRSQILEAPAQDEQRYEVV